MLMVTDWLEETRFAVGRQLDSSEDSLHWQRHGARRACHVDRLECIIQNHLWVSYVYTYYVYVVLNVRYMSKRPPCPRPPSLLSPQTLRS
jgi:hypothetical protein